MKLAILAGFLVVLGIIGILVSTIVRVHERDDDPEIDYGILLDAGSTSTKAYIYEWEHKTTPSLPFVSVSMSHDKVPRTLKTRPGIGTLSPNVTEVGNYLEPIVDWADSIIPKDKKASTPIYFQGTGGIRKLSETEQGALLTSVRFKLQDSGFKFDSSYASILTTTQEAGYGFLAVNGLNNAFTFGDTNNADIHGSLDMGGVSAEIAFISEDRPPANYSFVVEINGTSYTVYAQGIDGLGINQARYAFNASLLQNSNGSIGIIDPCAPAGFTENATITYNGELRSFTFLGSSNYNECSSLVKTFVQAQTINLPRPPIGDITFVVADHYLDVKKFYHLKDNANILELEAKTASFCGLNYIDAVSRFTKFDTEVQNYCFMGNYIVSLLRDYFGFDTAKRHILWKDNIHKSPVTWTLGSMMNIVDDIPPDTSHQTKTRLIRFFRTAGGTAVLFISCLLFVLGIVLFILQRRRPSEYVPIRFARAKKD
eukprot:Phypoly_transcript_05580.p1 GENE.Phypoly_transcript_05580~~Phypoly_transcript_05580.p1  ORF type:complete len:484 (+),score=42.03 Phypoly_transcript_05580:293-1744(+)